jgi:hypothetical protein
MAMGWKGDRKPARRTVRSRRLELYLRSRQGPRKGGVATSMATPLSYVGRRLFRRASARPSVFEKPGGQPTARLPPSVVASAVRPGRTICPRLLHHGAEIWLARAHRPVVATAGEGYSTEDQQGQSERTALTRRLMMSHPLLFDGRSFRSCRAPPKRSSAWSSTTLHARDVGTF